MDPIKCFPVVNDGSAKNDGSATPEEYGGSVRECIEFYRDGGDDSNIKPACVAISVDELPNGRNY